MRTRSLENKWQKCRIKVRHRHRRHPSDLVCRQEFCAAMHLIECVRTGLPLPDLSTKAGKNKKITKPPEQSSETSETREKTCANSPKRRSRMASLTEPRNGRASHVADGPCTFPLESQHQQVILTPILQTLRVRCFQHYGTAVAHPISLFDRISLSPYTRTTVADEQSSTDGGSSEGKYVREKEAQSPRQAD